MFKKIFFLLFVIILLGLVILFHNPISDKIVYLLDNQNEVKTENNNSYKRYYSYYYIDDVDNYYPYSYKGLLNIIYTVLNNGWSNFTFYCPVEYVDCIKDIKKITEDNVVLTHINNYAHPYNNFANIRTTVDSAGQVNIEVHKLYTEPQINEINLKVDEIFSKIDVSLDLEDKIKYVHDYIVNNTSYDMDKVNGESKYMSNTAYGALIQGQAICSGYADAMAIFLTKLNVPNYKIASETHVWNAIFIDNNWYHLDATWDDQIDTLGKEKLTHKFFIINTENLKKYATTDHNFDMTVYQEFRYN